MGNVFGKYAEWEVNEDEIDDIEQQEGEVEEMNVEPNANVENVVKVPVTGEPNVDINAVQQPEISPKPRRGRSNSGSFSKSNSDVTEENQNISPKPRRGRTNSGSFSKASGVVENVITTSVVISEVVEMTTTPKPKRGRTNSGLKAVVIENSNAAEAQNAENNTPKRERTNSGLKASAEMPAVETPSKAKRGRTNSASFKAVVEEPIKEQEVTEEVVEEKEEETESPQPKRGRPKTTSNLKRKRTTSFSAETPSVTVEETTVVPEPESTPVTKRPTKKRATSPRVDNKLASKADVVGGTIPLIIDHSNYSRLSKEELITQPRRSLRQTPLKDVTSNGVQATPKSSIKKSRAPKASSPVKQERSPSPKRKLFATPKKDSPTQTPRRGRKPSKKALGVD